MRLFQRFALNKNQLKITAENFAEREYNSWVEYE